MSEILDVQSSFVGAKPPDVPIKFPRKKVGSNDLRHVPRDFHSNVNHDDHTSLLHKLII